MTMRMFGVCVNGNQYLKPFAPNLLCKFGADFQRQLRCDILFLKAEIAVIGFNAACFGIRVLDCGKLLIGCFRFAVDTIDVEFVVCLFRIGCVLKHPAQTAFVYRP